MPSFKNLFAISALACLAGAKTIRIKATSDNKFSPDSVEAKEGDVLEFHFEPSNHSVTAGIYDAMCEPEVFNADTSFFSGYMPVDDGEANEVFRVIINDTLPIPFFSTQGTECGDGMVGMINPSGEQTLDDYRAITQGSNPSGEPNGTSVMENWGGVLAENDAVAAIGVSMASLLAVVGVSLLMV